MTSMDDEPEIFRKIREARQRRSATYHGYASGDLDDLAGGRYGVLPKPTVIGATAVSSYPSQPAGSPWAKDECPPEPLIDGTSEGLRLGYRIDGGDGDATEADLGRVASDAPDAAGAGSGIRLRRRI